MRILVTGGAGYIGSHVARALLDDGWDIVILDNLSFGHAAAVERLAGGASGGRVVFVQGDVADAALVEHLVQAWEIAAAVHLASYIQVGESVRDPALYYRNNVTGGLTLIESLRRAGVGRFVLSSTAAVYGEPEVTPIPDTHPARPVNPYGASKAMLEQVLRDYDRAYGFRYVALRYFNAAGAHPAGDLGEDHHPETHLIPIVLQAALGRREAVTVFGGDYPTPDGTAVRDYIHVCDLADAHVLAVRRLLAGGGSGVWNLGTGRGYSVLEVIAAAERVTGRPVPHAFGPRRDGDPAVLLAAAGRAREDLGWTPRRSGLEEIVGSAWDWHRIHPFGYAGMSMRR